MTVITMREPPKPYSIHSGPYINHKLSTVPSSDSLRLDMGTEARG